MIPAHDVNVLDFGAYNDGTHVQETTDALNQAFLETGIIYIPDGVYAINASLNVTNLSCLIGGENTIIQMTVPNIIAIRNVHIQDLRFENLTIIGVGGYDLNSYNPDPQDGGFYIDVNAGHLINNIYFKNITVKNINGGGIQAKSYITNITMENCLVDSCNFTAYTMVGENMLIKNCTSTLTRMYLETYGISNSAILTVENAVATDLVFYGICTYGGGAINIDGIYFTGISKYSISGKGYGVWYRGGTYTEGVSVFKIKNYKATNLYGSIELDNESASPHLIEELKISSVISTDVSSELLMKNNNVLVNNEDGNGVVTSLLYMIVIKEGVSGDIFLSHFNNNSEDLVKILGGDTIPITNSNFTIENINNNLQSSLVYYGQKGNDFLSKINNRFSSTL